VPITKPAITAAPAIGEPDVIADDAEGCAQQRMRDQFGPEERPDRREGAGVAMVLVRQRLMASSDRAGQQAALYGGTGRPAGK
jgi:hypothetical protein